MSNEHLAQYAAAVDVFDSEGGRQSSSDAERPVLKPGIEPDAADDCSKGYRYEQLADAVAYALLIRSTPVEEEDVVRPSHRNAIAAPDDADWALMASLGIQFDGRAFRFAEYRYDRLKDAVKSARRAGAAR